jgi:hypothetical protein
VLVSVTRLSLVAAADDDARAASAANAALDPSLPAVALNHALTLPALEFTESDTTIPRQ